MVKGIIFNTDMVRAILDGRKTVTRRVVKMNGTSPDMLVKNHFSGCNKDVGKKKGLYAGFYGDEDKVSNGVISVVEAEYAKSPYDVGDILYVRETWQFAYKADSSDQVVEETGRYIYYADDPMPFSYWVDTETGEHKDRVPWKPSIHMPKDAARIWLRVKNISVERLQDIDDDGVIAEGLEIGAAFDELWNSTVQKKDTNKYGWNANPFVWVITFERCEKPKNEV